MLEQLFTCKICGENPLSLANRPLTSGISPEMGYSIIFRYSTAGSRLREIVVTMQMSYLRAKCTKFDFAGGAYSAPRPMVEFKGLLLMGKKGVEGREDEGGEGEWRSLTHYFRLKTCTEMCNIVHRIPT